MRMDKSSKKAFFVTTPIYYVNAPLHMGHAYCTIAADTLARWHRLRGEDVFFLTGTDEHGANIVKIAEETGVSPQAWVDDMAAKHQEFNRELSISNDDFIRTSEKRHEKVVQEFWRKLKAGKAPDGKPNIYLGEYEGLYCRPCENYFQEADLIGGNCPIHGLPVEKLKEECYFFNLSGYQKFFETFLDEEEKKGANDRFVVPDVRFNEVAGLVKQGLKDRAITRTKITWGVPVPDDPKHVVYVWFDAVMNYVTAAGFNLDQEMFGRLWPADMHLIGKEIIWFHALMWPAMLKGAGLPLPKKIAAHGWWTVEGEKISKSRGNAVDPRTFAEDVIADRAVRLDSIRYYLMREIGFGSDGDFSKHRFVERYNADLANDFGNLAHRTISMAFRYLGGKVRRPRGPSPWEEFIRNRWKDEGLHGDIKETASGGLTFTQAALVEFMDGPLAVPQFQGSLCDIWEVIGHGNKYLDTQAPWNKPKEEQEEILGHVLELLEAVSWPLWAFIPALAARLRERLGLKDAWPSARGGEKAERAALPEVFSLAEGDPLFPRIDTRKKKQS